MSVKFDTRALMTSLTRIQKRLAKVPDEAYKEFVKNTPVDTGNARRKTRKTRDGIDADYEYSGVLDKGRHMTNRGMRGSEQAPEGMSKPTAEFVKKRVEQIIKAK